MHEAAGLVAGGFIVRARVISALLLAVLGIGGRGVLAERPAARPDLQGTWNGSSRTPFQRPPQLADRSVFTPEEAAEWVKATPDRVRNRLPMPDDPTQIDIDDTYVEVERMPMDGLRTSLSLDP